MCLPWSVVVLASAAVGRLQVRACEIAREDALFAAVRMDTTASRTLTTNDTCGHPPER